MVYYISFKKTGPPQKDIPVFNKMVYQYFHGGGGHFFLSTHCIFLNLIAISGIDLTL